jgi:hypothetical protein
VAGGAAEGHRKGVVRGIRNGILTVVLRKSKEEVQANKKIDIKAG